MAKVDADIVPVVDIICIMERLNEGAWTSNGEWNGIYSTNIKAATGSIIINIFHKTFRFGIDKKTIGGMAIKKKWIPHAGVRNTLELTVN